MADSGVSTAVAGANTAGLVAAYDRYAAALYDYCFWMRPDPAIAADALRTTFAAVAAWPDALPADRKLRGPLYEAVRIACHGPAASPGARPDEVAGLGMVPAELGEARRLARAVLADLDPLEQEIVELRFRHHLTAIETADVLGLRPDQVPDLTESARRYLEEVLGALVVVRAGPPSCPQLSALLAGRGEPLAASTAKLAARHISHCRECDGQRPGALSPERLLGLLPLVTLPDELHEMVLPGPAAGPDDRLMTTDRPPGPAGAGRAVAFQRRDAIRVSPRVTTATAAAMVAVAAAVTAVLMASAGPDTGHALAAQSSAPPTVTVPSIAAAPASPRSSRSPAPAPAHRTATTVAAPVASLAVVPAVNVVSPVPSHRAPAKTPSKAPTKTPSKAPVSPSPSASKSTKPTPTPTPSRTPTPTPTATGSASPSPSASGS